METGNKNGRRLYTFCPVGVTITTSESLQTFVGHAALVLRWWLHTNLHILQDPTVTNSSFKHGLTHFAIHIQVFMGEDTPLLRPEAGSREQDTQSMTVHYMETLALLSL